MLFASLAVCPEFAIFFETVPVVVGFVGGIAVDVLFAQKVSVVLGLCLLPE